MTIGPFDGRIDDELVRRFAAATNDRSPFVPPMAVATRIWDAQEAARHSLVPVEVQRSAIGGVHGEHDVVIHRPLVAGEPLQLWVDTHGTRPAGRNALVTLRYTAVDADGVTVAEQWWTTVYFGTTCVHSGEPAPDHAFPDDARARPIGTWSVDVDADMARRYAEASGDWSPHHFEVDAARRSGFDRVFLHGLCTMALCARGVTELVADGDPRRVRRVAVRFASPMFLDETLAVRVYDAGPLGYAFDAECAGATVISHGRAEVRPDV